MVKIVINNKMVKVHDGATVLQACQQADIEVPFFCYHPKLSIAGNCRMCLVEIENSSKLVASCSIPVQDGMVVRTDTPKVKNARKSVLEFLLINHPLDCPICDQGGECDLQDITVAYGPDTSKYKENKRAVDDKDFGPLIKTSMNRCIHCTRCIRFSDEVAGTQELGAIHRGENMEITSYVKGALASELSGNMIDICPVGALTSKPYAFKGRSWELKKTESIDVNDALGSNIRIDSRGQEVMRILPRLNEAVNEQWISDKARFAYDGLKYQRLDRPYLKRNGYLEPCSWEEALSLISSKLLSTDGSDMAGLVGPLADCESIVAFKDILGNLGCLNMDCRLQGEYLPTADRTDYIFNSTLEGVEKADVILLVGTNPRLEAPLLNARIRKHYLEKGPDIALIGKKIQLTYPYEHIGETTESLRSLYAGEHSFSKRLKEAKNPILIIGQGVLSRKDGPAIYRLCVGMAKKYGMVKEDKLNFNVLHKDASMVGALDIGFVPSPGSLDAMKVYEKVRNGKLDTLYLLGVDDFPLNAEDVKNTFIIYQGHHGDKGAHLADVVLPGCAYTEKDALYVNTEGRVQEALKAVWAPGEAKEDWRIFRELSSYLGKVLPYDTLMEVRRRLEKVNPIFGSRDLIKSISLDREKKEKPELNFNIDEAVFLDRQALTSSIENFYMTNVITRHSPTMASCIESFCTSSKDGAHSSGVIEKEVS